MISNLSGGGGGGSGGDDAVWWWTEPSIRLISDHRCTRLYQYTPTTIPAAYVTLEVVGHCVTIRLALRWLRFFSVKLMCFCSKYITNSRHVERQNVLSDTHRLNQPNIIRSPDDSRQVLCFTAKIFSTRDLNFPDCRASPHQKCIGGLDLG